ncbi:MAG: 4Fe-4S dicluster domain-containing protein [Promethearchaeota archaeon]
MTERTIVVEDFYELLRQRMDKWPTRTPKSPDIMKILKELFTEEEAEIMSHFKAALMDQASPIEISQRSGKPIEEVIEILNSLADRGLMFKMGKSRKRAKFALWPTVIGIFEFVFSNPKIYSEEKLKRLARLFDKYLNRYIIPTAGASNYPFPRVLPSKTSEKVIELNEDLGIVSQKVLPFEEVEELINKYTAFSVMPCSCRTKAEALGYPNEMPIDVCMAFDMGAEFFIENGMAKRLTKEEALDLLIQCEKKGMVHCTLNAQTPDFICNCDKEHCGILKGITKFHRTHGLAFSNFRIKIDESIDCTECYRCVDLCPTHAIFPSIEEGGKFNLELKKDLCIGCGVCSTNCSSKRLILEKVENKIPVESMPDAYRKYGEERFMNKLF